MGTKTLLTVVAALSLVSACNTAPDPPVGEPRFRLTVEEAGFVAKGELFRIYGDAADPVIVDVSVTETEVNGEPGWLLEVLVNILVDGDIEQRRWNLWVALDSAGYPAVMRAEEEALNPASG